MSARCGNTRNGKKRETKHAVEGCVYERHEIAGLRIMKCSV